MLEVPKTFWRHWGPPPLLGGGEADPLETRPPHVLSCNIWSFYVKGYGHTYGDRPENWVPRVPTFKVTQGNRNRLGPIGHLCLLWYKKIRSNCGYRTASEINGDFGWNSQFFSHHTLLRAFTAQADQIPLGIL